MPQNITNKDCIGEVKKREKIYDAECSGLYVSLSPTAPPTFSLKYTCRITKQRATQWLGIYQKGGEGSPARDVAYWRREAMKLKIRIGNGEDIAQAARQAHDRQAKQQLTVGQLIDQRIAWISEEIEVRRHTEDGVIIKRKPRMKDWSNMASHLNRFVRPRLGSMVAREVTNDDIAQLQADILAGTLIIRNGKAAKKGSVSSARHMRKAVSGLFNWAAEAGRKYVSTSPCVNLPALPQEEPRKRKLSPDEIRILWHGLDRPDMPIDRRICLALKFALASMLRSVEMLHIHRDELGRDGLASKLPLVVIPEERVKKGREIHQPLSDLAVEIAKEAKGNYPWLFAGRFGTEPLNRKAMACALRGKTKLVKGKVVIQSEGICRMLGLKPFTPHDLRRTAASLMGNIKVPRSIISLCLDHTIKSDEHGDVSPITGKHYDQDPRIAEKREALQLLADEIRRIVAEPVQAQEEMKRAA
ncbi:tyrosine-type recombinase/integrase [Bradyrhizobium septentrionale]|uniref:tyrosine-type recombinase/integrase n=1 Tax=Bradyrhizobium septentrionale TaxID=1404411 RepID=UPI0015968C53|nr:tyrosine-type recombinase/integrase [Bradyrhizobium septentrionale]UGY24966.1 tyrosine-type recombinase/integrase [Bradyrhizobium septentrionale]